MNCFHCDKSEVEGRIHKCPICFRWICEDCGKRDYGRTFCSQRCADQLSPNHTSTSGASI